MIAFFIGALKIIFLLGFLVFIHEGGHFLVAKLCKIRVNEFAIGFGPTVWKKQGKETKYALRLIPLGGFVSMEGEEERSENEGSFSKASIPRRIAVVVAGGVVNILFGLLVYFVLIASVSGNLASSEGFVTTIISEAVEGYQAKEAGLQSGDEIIRINGKRVRLKNDVDEAMQQSNGEEVTLTIKRQDDEKEIKLVPTEVKTRNTGIYFGAQSQELTTEIIAVYPKSPAEKQGIQVKDVITKVNGTEVNGDPYQVIELLKEATTDEIVFTIQRHGEEIEITLTPDIVSTYLLGVNFKVAESNLGSNLYYGFWTTQQFAFSIIDNLKMLFTGQVSTNQLTGPIGISEMVAKTNGFAEFIYLLALISLSLGVTNLLPFPALDGGKIVLLVIEAIRRKPLKENIEIGIQMLGFALLIVLSIYIAYNDILRIF